MKKKQAHPERLRRVRAAGEAYLYLAPFLIGLAVFTLYPVVNVFLLSFREDYSYLNGTYAGWSLENYQKVLSDPKFTQAIRNTLLYVLAVVPVSTALAVIIAWLLNRRLRGSALFRPPTLCRWSRRSPRSGLPGG